MRINEDQLKFDFDNLPSSQKFKQSNELVKFCYEMLRKFQTDYVVVGDIVIMNKKYFKKLCNEK